MSNTVMKEFYGTKKIRAIPMTRAVYNQYRGWELPKDEDGHDAGYLVEYLDGGKPNDSRHEGYISWSPADAFSKAYQPMTDLSFGHAIEAMKDGKKVAREGWNGKGMYIILVPGTPDVEPREGSPYFKALGAGVKTEILPHIDMWTVNSAGRRAFLPGWLASQTDMLANDWQVIE